MCEEEKKIVTISLTFILCTIIDNHSLNFELCFTTYFSHTSFSQGNVEMVKYFIEVQGCSATTTDDYKQTPLHYACL